MAVDQVLNNNVVSSQDEAGREIILMGRGIGWHVHPGEVVDRSKIEKIFRMETLASTDRLKQLFLEVDVEAIRASIAMHIINAEYDCDMEKTFEMTSIIQEALNVVRYTFHIHYEEEITFLCVHIVRIVGNVSGK